MTLPEGSSYADIERLDGARGTVIGTYQQVDVRARQRPPAVHRGHAAVRLPDGHLVHIEPVWTPEAIRTPEEVARADGKQVRITGVVLLQSPEPAEPIATIIGPCVAHVESVDVT